MSPEGLDRTQRLRRRAEFLSVQRGGRRHETAHFLVFVRRRTATQAHGRSSPAVGARLGITVTRKVGTAVVRNRIRRLIRETFRRMAMRWPDDVDVVVVAKLSARELTLPAAFAELETLCQKLTRTAPPRSA